MTIAIGIQAHRGIAIAADTLVTLPNGTAKEESKLSAFTGQSGIFVIANASNDLNATKTMANSLQDMLRNTRLPNVGDLQAEVSREMLDWYGKLASDQTSQFVFAAKLHGDEPRLYLCEPPSTFLQITDCYIAAGIGAFVTDLLHSLLFRTTGYTNIQAALRQMSYLIYRAKKDNAFCGKRTSCAIIGIESKEPIIVNPLDMQLAEREAGQLDFLVQSTTTLYLESTEANIHQNSQGIAQMMVGQQTMRTRLFHDTYGQEITL